MHFDQEFVPEELDYNIIQSIKIWNIGDMPYTNINMNCKYWLDFRGTQHDKDPINRYWYVTSNISDFSTINFWFWEFKLLHICITCKNSNNKQFFAKLVTSVIPANHFHYFKFKFTSNHKLIGFFMLNKDNYQWVLLKIFILWYQAKRNLKDWSKGSRVNQE